MIMSIGCVRLGNTCLAHSGEAGREEKQDG
jgi:hypothetical protein